MSEKIGRTLLVSFIVFLIILPNTFVAVANFPGEATEKYTEDQSSQMNPNSCSIELERDLQSLKKTGRFFNDLCPFSFGEEIRSVSSRENFRDNYHFVFDEDSIEMVIGIEYEASEAYARIVDEVEKLQGKIINTVSIRDKTIAAVVDLPFNSIPLLMERVSASGLIRYIEPNRRFHAVFTPNDPYWSYQWGPQKIEVDWAWNTTTGNRSILVAVIDTGIDYTHPDLADKYVALGYDWINGDSDPLDDNGHGTHCAGIIAAVINNALGIAGIANVTIMAEKGLDAYGYGTEDALANAIIHAVDQGADILSNSWGDYFDSYLIHDAVQYAYENGVLIIAAAGNDAQSNKLYPAAYDEVIAVTATDSFDNPAYFTNFGDWVEVAAPGVNIYSTMPTYYVTLNDYGYSMNYDNMSGTSMACPHVAGVAALIWSQFPKATRDWVRAQLRFTANDLGDPGFDDYYGYGRINARNAVERAPLDHDILIFDYKKPAHIKPGDNISLNVTILNFGLNDEENITVQLLIDGNLTDSKTINYLVNGTLATVNLQWSPLKEGIFNVTLYVVPVQGETATENNVITEMISVKYPLGFVLFDQTRCDSISYYSQWIVNLSDRGYIVDTYTGGTITPDVLADYNIFVIPQAWSGYSSDEISAIQNFVLAGGGLLVIGDSHPEYYTNLTSFAGIIWDYETYGWSGYTTNITIHEVTEGVSWVYFGAPSSQLFVSSPAVSLIRDGNGLGETMLAASEVGAGRVIAIADEDTINNWNIGYADNLLLANNMIDWLSGTKYQHELIVRLDAPAYIEPNMTLILNATVYNRGLNNETNVELKLLINGTIVSNVTIPLLVNGSFYTLNYTWTPNIVAVYNVTAFAPPVPEENVTINNVAMKFVHVQYPIINPEPGQYAYYLFKLYSPTGIPTEGYWNFTYDYYIERYKMHVTTWQKTPDGYIFQDWMIVNTMNRLIESGSNAGWWYFGWIETDIDIGSTINLLDGTATVSGTKVLLIGPKAIDCWEIPYSMYGYLYTFWYDKQSGLWIGMNSTNPYTGEYAELLLTDTNVQIGIQYEHDLGVTLDAPICIQPGETTVLNATVYNLGLNNETDVEIYLLINGTEVKSETLDVLVNGTSYTLNYSWTPMKEGVYNITAYTPIRSYENVTINNVVTEIVYVRYIEVALISDYSELMTIAPILDSMGIGYDIYNNNYYNRYTEDLNMLLNYKAVIFYTGSRWISSAEYSALESYLSFGGNLLITGFDCLVSDSLLAELVRSSTTGDNVGEPDLIVVNEEHPIMNGPYGSFPAGYHVYNLYSDCDIAEADEARGAVTVAELLDGYDKIIATEGLPGKVVYWNGRGEHDWTQNDDCQAMFKNTIHWFVTPYEHDLLVSLQAPEFLEPNDSTLVNATITNIGLNNETNVEIQLLINGTVVESATDLTLLTDESYTISYLWRPKIAGFYNITVYAPPVPGENVTRNNVFSKIVKVRYAPRILAYIGYADYYDYANTIKSIESTFGPNYKLTEFTDYTQLDTMITGNDILLIPDQEYASTYTLQMIGEAWAQTLLDFLEKGGIIVLCDGGYGYGGTYAILTGAQLMSISGTNYRSGYRLYLTDPDDPLAKGVSSTFYGPYYTVSFITEEENVVVDDGVYPVVIHKEWGNGHIILLGFDFESFSEDAQTTLGNAVSLACYLTLWLNPSAGCRGVEATVYGIKATANGTVSIYWDDQLVENVTADKYGNFKSKLVVPADATIGLHKVMALDTTTGKTGSADFRVILITLNPSMGEAGTKVTVSGKGFAAETQITITFNDMLIGYIKADNLGNFTFEFNVPFSTAGVHVVKALDSEGNCIYTNFVVIDVSTLDVKVDAGTIHFRGEIAEFYLQTSFKGQAVNASQINATLYGPDGEITYYCYPENISTITTGLYKILYNIPADAKAGTYMLVINAAYITDTIQARGTSFGCFSISQTLLAINAHVEEIKDGIATIVMPGLDTIKLNLTAMNVTLEKIFLKVIAINGTTAIVQTALGTMEGTITDVGTIVVPGIGEIQADLSELKGRQQMSILSQYITVVLAAIAAAGTITSTILVKRRKAPKLE